MRPFYAYFVSFEGSPPPQIHDGVLFVNIIQYTISVLLLPPYNTTVGTYRCFFFKTKQN
jgi:hypothetical protein